MTNIDNLREQIVVFSDYLDEQIIRLHAEERNVQDSLDKVSSKFGGDEAGQQISISLYQLLNTASMCESAIQNAKDLLQQYVAQLYQ